jgi:flagellar protein FliO/FliZ
MRSVAARLGWAALLFTPALLAAEAETPRLFAAPDLAASAPAGGAGGLGQVLFALVIVLVAVFAAAILVKRLRGFSAGSAHGIEVLAQVSLGSKERAVIVRVAGQRLLLGVASGQVSLLQTLPADSPDTPSAPVATGKPQAPRFQDLLRRSLGR